MAIYINDGKFDMLAVKVEAEEPSLDQKTVTENGTYNASDDSLDGYSNVIVDVPIPEPVLQTRSVTPSETAQQIRAQAGYDALEEEDIAAIPTTYVGSDVARRSSSDLSASGATVSVPSGYYPNQASKSVSGATQATPSITVSSGGLITASADQSAGYVSSGTKSATKQLTTQAAKTVTPSTSEQTAVNSGVYTTGVVKVAAVPTETKSITENGTYTPTSGKFFSSIEVNVPQSGGGGMNVQCYHGMVSVKTTSYSATGVKLTVAKTGTYKVSWMGCRNTNSGTNGSQLYINNSAYGSATTSFTNTYGQSVVLNNVSLTAGQTVEVRARARSTSYAMMVGNLCIEQTA